MKTRQGIPCLLSTRYLITPGPAGKPVLTGALALDVQTNPKHVVISYDIVPATIDAYSANGGVPPSYCNHHQAHYAKRLLSKDDQRTRLLSWPLVAIGCMD